jgi:glycosidase
MTGWGDWEARAPMVWNPNAAQKRFRDHLRTLARMRREHPVLATGGIRFLEASNTRHTLAFERFDEHARALVLLNMGPFDQVIEGHAVPARDWRIVWA